MYSPQQLSTSATTSQSHSTPWCKGKNSAWRIYAFVVLLLDREYLTPLRWCHNDHAGVSNHQPHGYLLNRLSRRKSKKTSKLRVTGLCVGNSPGTGEFPAQMASYAENVSIWWRHHDTEYPIQRLIFGRRHFFKYIPYKKWLDTTGQ